MDAITRSMPQAASLHRRDWLLLVVTLPIIAVLSLGAHDVAISHLGIPYPKWDLPPWVPAVGQASRIGGAVVLYRCAAGYFRDRSLLSAILIIGFLFVFLQETLRVICVEFALDEAWVDGRWIAVLVIHLPGTLLSLIQPALAVPIGLPRQKQAGPGGPARLRRRKNSIRSPMTGKSIG